MSLLDDTLAIALGTANANSTNTSVVVVDAVHSNAATINDDQEHARQQLLKVIEQSANAIEHLMKISKVSQHPRAYEVLEKLLMRQQDAATHLLELHNQRADINKKNRDTTLLSGANVNQTYIANAVFTGTTAELLDRLSGKNREVIEHDDLLDIDVEE